MSTSDLLNAVHNGQCWPCMKIIETHKDSMRTVDFYQGIGRLAMAYAVFICCWRMLEIAGFNQMAAMWFPDSACAASEMQPLASHDVSQSMAP